MAFEKHVEFPLMQLPSFLRNKIVWAIGALLVAVLVWRWTSAGDATPKFSTEATGRGEVVARVSASGTLSALVKIGRAHV